MRLKAADLFSGTGGISLALQPVMETVLFCELDPECRQVIERNMQRGKLDKAIIESDVHAVKGSTLKKLGVKAITAGFPCQDAACSNPNGKGLEGDRTGLFWQIVRIIDEANIDVVFLENSACIMKISKPIVSALLKRGFKVAHGIFSAADVGAPHIRRRWFCLAYKVAIDTRALKLRKNVQWFDAKEPCSRVVPIPPDRASYAIIKRRCQMMGNAVVPKQVQFAFKSLTQAVVDPMICEKCYAVGKCINLYDPKHSTLCKPISSVEPRARNLRMATRTRTHWSTPTFHDSCCRFTLVPSPRRWQSISEEIYHERSTFSKHEPLEGRSMKYLINPNFLEYLMGFPKDWTIFKTT
jgi:hypothetical protein